MASQRRRKDSVRSQFSPRLGGVIVLVVFVAVVVSAGVIVPRLMELAERDSTAQAWQAEPPAAGAAIPRVDLPDIEFPSPADPPPEFSFTEEEVNALNEMLNLWAAQETYIRVVPDEDEDDSDALDSASAQDTSSQDASAQNIATEASSPQSASAQNTSNAEAEYKPDGGHDVAVWFVDIQSGAQYVYNEQFQFSYASLMKGPYAAWLYSLAAAGGCDLEEMVEVRPEDIGKYAENTGVLKTMELPGQFSVETLIGYMLEKSDTVALKILLARYPAENFRQWAAEQGVQDADGLKSVLSGKVSAADMGALAAAVYQVMEYGEHGALLRQHLENAGNKMVTSEYAVAHKYGWDEHAYHDMAVVYAPHPYVIVIMTDKWGGSYEEKTYFGTISRTLEEMMAAKWADYEAQAAE